MHEEIRQGINQLLAELNEQAVLGAEDILVIGCSTSEILGQRIGSASNLDIAEVLVEEILAFCRRGQIQPAFQCCEHLNRALVLERSVAKTHVFDEVSVLPVAAAGGAVATKAMELLSDPVVVETIAAQGKAGIDIGNTLIGMHLRPVAVPVRTKTVSIGKAAVICARTRPKLIGGSRAVYLDR